ncbi:helix-turn-helix domain-containing protein [Mycobacterium sp. KBS0706]|uniref:helix-turn-helix domain-containing protein n=1 Tax=Mycobacterium sp. KBS0706 TaxID=2578109 RepID=UPI00110FBF1D|nr:helix-turn-helix domain-containing protein [Mycobacterium sp. KBS0706]TSD83470.1 helix-turn-helix domain-containing protein [Mycobacterium sp. KBS0706]
MPAPSSVADAVAYPRSRPTAQNKLALIDAAWVCHHLPELAHLTQADKAVLCGLIRHIDQAALDAGKTTVFPSNLCLSLDTGYTERQVTRSIKRLEATGLIRRFLRPRWRTSHTDLTGFCGLAAAALDAHVEEKDRRLHLLRRGGPVRLVELDTESACPDTESSPTETDIEPAISVQQSDAARDQSLRRPATPATTDGQCSATTHLPANGTSANCSPGGAGFSARARLDTSTPAERVRADLLTAWEASPTLRRIVDLEQLRTTPFEALAPMVERDYLSAVTGQRNPQRIWSWAVNRHGLAIAILGWIIACDTPRSADRPERNPGGWFTRFATSDRPWDLSRNLRQLAKAPRPHDAASTVHLPDNDETTSEPSIPARQPTITDDEAVKILVAYRAAWIHAATARIGHRRAEAAWKSWLDEAAVTGVDDERLEIRVKTRFACDQVFKDYGDVCRIAAEALGFAGADFHAEPRPRQSDG